MVVSYRRVIAEILGGYIKLTKEEKKIEMKVYNSSSFQNIELEKLKESYEELGTFIKEVEEIMRLEAL